MKTIAKLMLLVLVCCSAVIASWEVFNLHPQFSVGKVHSIWAGFRHMEFTSGTMSVPLVNGQKEIQKGYHVGPIQIAIVTDSKK